MERTIRKLRRKYIITAFFISFSVIAAMILVLNLLMQMSYRKEQNIATDLITQAAIMHTEDLNQEYVRLSDAAQNADGDYIISRDVRKISSITLYGNISCNSTSANWYSAGGGLMFEVQTDNEKKLVYQEYAFNKDTTNIVIDFEDFDQLKYDGQAIAISEDDITGEYFLVSIVWWKNCSDPTAAVSLTVDSIVITYKESVTTAVPDDTVITHGDFSNLFETAVPEILHSTSAFCLITDENNMLLSVNSGNLLSELDDETARELIKNCSNSNNKTGTAKVNASDYQYTVSNIDNLKIWAFIDNSAAEMSSQNLLWISITVGVGVLLFLFVLIWFISKRVVKPVADSFTRQKQFISNASHELKTPITVILTTIDIISRQKGDDKWTECIKNQSNKMQHLVYELLDLSRLSEPQTAKQKFQRQDISRVVNRSLLYFESRFFESEKTLDCFIEPNLTMQCDAEKISQLIGILIDNALKYSDEKSIISFSLKQEKETIVLRCSNPCANFSVADCSMVFERFYRSDNDQQKEQEGFGLGLSIAKAITELHSGTITADFENGIVQFTVRLPIV